MKVLVAPLNWGLGHASRCIPLIEKYLAEKDEVVIAGDGESLMLLRRRFPKLRTIALPNLHLHYASGTSQTWTIAKQVPHILRWAICDHRALNNILAIERFDLIVSDNRFGFYSHNTRCIYITHQLHICLPAGWQWLEPAAEYIHRKLMNKYSEVQVPDYAGSPNLGGMLSHPKHSPKHIHYIGPLSRFNGTGLQNTTTASNTTYHTVLLLSGLEPQRSLLEKEIIHRYQGSNKTLLVVQGKMNVSFCRFTKGNITIVPYLDDTELVSYLLGADIVIARSGYSTLMDFAALGILPKCELIATPGQPEQEYLATYNKIL